MERASWDRKEGGRFEYGRGILNIIVVERFSRVGRFVLYSAEVDTSSEEDSR